MATKAAQAKKNGSNAYDDCVLRVTEGVSSVWHYHLSESHRQSRGLCGAWTMVTAIQLKDWRTPFGEHFPKRPTWCKTCDRLATVRDAAPASVKLGEGRRS